MMSPSNSETLTPVIQFDLDSGRVVQVRVATLRAIVWFEYLLQTAIRVYERRDPIGEALLKMSTGYAIWLATSPTGDLPWEPGAHAPEPPTWVRDPQLTDLRRVTGAFLLLNTREWARNEARADRATVSDPEFLALLGGLLPESERE